MCRNRYTEQVLSKHPLKLVHSMLDTVNFLSYSHLSLSFCFPQIHGYVLKIVPYQYPSVYQRATFLKTFMIARYPLHYGTSIKYKVDDSFVKHFLFAIQIEDMIYRQAGVKRTGFTGIHRKKRDEFCPSTPSPSGCTYAKKDHLYQGMFFLPLSRRVVQEIQFIITNKNNIGLLPNHKALSHESFFWREDDFHCSCTPTVHLQSIGPHMEKPKEVWVCQHRMIVYGSSA